MTSSEFATKILKTCTSSSVVVSAFVADTGATWIKIRAFLTDDSFIDAFFNEVTGKIAYAWVKDERRILGVDNTRRWHWHPFTAPETHVPTKSPVSFADFLREVEKHLTPPDISPKR